MSQLDLEAVVRFIQDNVGPSFHDKKIAKLRAIKLEDVLRRKNPYLFKAKRTNDAAAFIKAVLDATVSSGEESVFGNFLENVAIYVCELAKRGRKSSTIGIDLEFEEGAIKYLVSIKSGPSWGNSSQIKHLISLFSAAKRTLRTSGGISESNIICIEACCYGKDDNPEKGTHQKLCGQRFWELISGGSETLYKDIIEPLGHQAREKTEELDNLYCAKQNVLVEGFLRQFCDNGVINWSRLIEYNSGKRGGSSTK